LIWLGRIHDKEITAQTRRETLANFAVPQLKLKLTEILKKLSSKRARPNAPPRGGFIGDEHSGQAHRRIR
jgi:hypothetical protein